MFSSIEEPYGKLPKHPKHLNSAITKIFYCFFREWAKNWRNTKNANISHFFWFWNLHHSSERACNHIKLYIYSESAPGNVSRNNIQLLQNTLIFFFFFLCIKTGQNRISYIFQEIVIPEIHVRLFEDFQNLIALQVWGLAFIKSFKQLAN